MTLRVFIHARTLSIGAMNKMTQKAPCSQEMTKISKLKK